MNVVLWILLVLLATSNLVLVLFILTRFGLVIDDVNDVLEEIYEHSEGEKMSKVKYRVYMKHVWGGNPIKLGLFDNKEDADNDSYKTKDAMYDSWVEEEVEESK